jgi:hypothetical protein
MNLKDCDWITREKYQSFDHHRKVIPRCRHAAQIQKKEEEQQTQKLGFSLTI